MPVMQVGTAGQGARTQRTDWRSQNWSSAHCLPSHGSTFGSACSSLDDVLADAYVEPDSGSPAETAACSALPAADDASSAGAVDELAWTPRVGAGFEVPPHATAAAPTNEKAKMMLSVRYIARRNLGGRSAPARDGSPRSGASRVAASLDDGPPQRRILARVPIESGATVLAVCVLQLVVSSSSRRQRSSARSPIEPNRDEAIRLGSASGTFHSKPERRGRSSSRDAVICAPTSEKSPDQPGFGRAGEGVCSSPSRPKRSRRCPPTRHARARLNGVRVERTPALSAPVLRPS